MSETQSTNSDKNQEGYSEELLVAIDNDDKEGVQLYVTSLKSELEWHILKLAILKNKKRIFHYLLSLDTDPNNLSQRTTLFDTVLTASIIPDHYAYDLLQKGIDLEQTTEKGNTFLHYAFKRKSVRVAQKLIEIGAEIDARNENLETPFHWCCLYCNDDILVQGVSMLMYYGADPSITTKKGHTPFDIVMLVHQNPSSILEDLFYYSFDEYTFREIDFGVVLKAVEQKWPLLDSLLGQASTIYRYDRYLHSHESPHVFGFESKHVGIFMENFDYVIERMVAKLFYYEDDMLDYSKLKTSHSLEVLDLLVNSKFKNFIIEIICEVQSTGLLDGLIAYKVPEDRITAIFCYLLSYGMNITDDSLQIIYKNFKYNELFQILLHMDVKEDTYEPKNVIPHLYYDVGLHIESFLNEPYTFQLCNEEELLPFCSRPQLKELCYKLNKMDITEKVNKLPRVPPLVELARDVFRKYFIETFHITNSRRFYTMLKLLPIGESQKKIISFQKELFLF